MLNFNNSHEAKVLQLKLANKIILKNSFRDISEIKTIAAMDLALKHNPRFMSLNEGPNIAYAACILFSFPSFEIINKYHFIGELKVPYIPGFLSFRESPVYLELIQEHNLNPDLYIFDGHGIAHPRHLGIAAHMGLVTNKPSIGCAKSLLYGHYDKKLLEENMETEIKSPQNEFLGYALKNKVRANPVFISAGHLIDQLTALTIIKMSCDGYRIPKPTRLADHYSKEIKKFV